MDGPRGNVHLISGGGVGVRINKAISIDIETNWSNTDHAPGVEFITAVVSAIGVSCTGKFQSMHQFVDDDGLKSIWSSAIPRSGPVDS